MGHFEKDRSSDYPRLDGCAFTRGGPAPGFHRVRHVEPIHDWVVIAAPAFLFQRETAFAEFLDFLVRVARPVVRAFTFAGNRFGPSCALGIDMRANRRGTRHGERRAGIGAQIVAIEFARHTPLTRTFEFATFDLSNLGSFTNYGGRRLVCSEIAAGYVAAMDCGRLDFPTAPVRVPFIVLDEDPDRHLQAAVFRRRA